MSRTSTAHSESDEVRVFPPCPRGLLIGVYVLYFGLATTASVPLLGDIDWLHEGERLGTAQKVLDGGLPFRDVYLPHGLFPEVIRPLLAFQMFGESLAADRLVGLLIEPLAYVAAVFYLWRLFPTPGWRIAGMVAFALYPLLIIPRHIAVFVALGLLTAWVYEQRSGYLFAAGLAAGLGYVVSTFDQATFLLATVLLFPFMMTAERVMTASAGTVASGSDEISLRTTFPRTALPLFGGLSLGLLPFLGYMGLTGTGSLFVRDMVNRIEADAYALSHVWGQQSLPPLNGEHMTWYAVPMLYLVMAVFILVRVRFFGDRYWTTVLPTLLFGIVSFTYATRQYTYWKLAVVSFPFLVCCAYVLYVASTQWTSRRSDGRMPVRDMTLLGLSGAFMVVLLVQAVTHGWNPKQVAPRFLFPGMALLILSVVASVAAGRVIPHRWRDSLVLGCPMAALILAVWFYNDAKPQVLSAQLKKPKLVSDLSQLVTSTVKAGVGLTREHPVFVQDEVVSYLKTASQEKRRVVILAVGAGVYYFHAGVSPPNRFPEVEITLADAWAQEVVEGLDRTLAVLLVACDDRGHKVTGWPMRTTLSRFIDDNYIDSGRRLRSKMLGESCPFEVWVHRRSLRPKPV